MALPMGHPKEEDENSWDFRETPQCLDKTDKTIVVQLQTSEHWRFRLRSTISTIAKLLAPWLKLSASSSENGWTTYYLHDLACIDLVRRK